MSKVKIAKRLEVKVVREVEFSLQGNCKDIVLATRLLANKFGNRKIGDIPDSELQKALTMVQQTISIAGKVKRALADTAI